MGLHEPAQLLPYSTVEDFKTDKAGHILEVSFRYKNLVYTLGNGQALQCEVVK